MYEPPTAVLSVQEAVRALDQRVSGLVDQKRRVSVLLRRHLLAAINDRPYSPANAIILGPTGGGKTFLVKEACDLSGLPFIEVNATQFSETGYWGRDLSWMFTDFVDKYAMRPREITPFMQRWGVVIIDEIDKLRMTPNLKERQPSRALQAELLKILEGDVAVAKRKDPEEGFRVRTHNILFIGVGAFEGIETTMVRRRGADRPNIYMLADSLDLMDYGFMQELVGRFPSIIALPPLDPTAMARIMMEHTIPQYVQEAEDAGLEFIIDEPAMREISSLAIQKRIGTRAFAGILDSMLWKPLSQAQPGDRLILDAAAVLGNCARLETKWPSTV